MKQRAKVRVSYELLADVLKIKQGNEIIGVVSTNEDQLNSCVRIVLTGKDCYKTPEGGVMMFNNALIGVEEANESQ